MKLSELIDGLQFDGLYGDDSTEIEYLSHSSNDIKPNTLFFCLSGTKSSGSDYASQAVKSGATAIICQQKIEGINATQIVVNDARTAMAQVAAAFYGFPAKKLKIVTIVGTNGKTTTSYVIRQILTTYGIKSGLLGTTAYYVGDKRLDAELTTPDPITLHKLLRQMCDDGCKVAVMEASAHAIVLNKLSGVVADCAIFTNVSQDHLDFFGDFDTYKNTKVNYFCSQNCRLAIVNADDQYCREAIKNADMPVVTYGYNQPSDVFGINYSCSPDGIDYIINLFDKIGEVQFKLCGEFNMYNTMAAATACRLLGVDFNAIIKGIAQINTIEGRYQILKLANGARAVVDYAHTPSAVENILNSIGEICQGKIITVLGCGGNRDKDKRSLMGLAAYENSNYCVFTSDNPRYEKPQSIIDDIIAQINDSKRYTTIVDRKAAITHALGMAQDGDWVAVLGKGAEKTQEIDGYKLDFDDTEVIKNYSGG